MLLFHYGGFLLVLFPPVRLLAPLIGAGYLGVDLFFILSGFILSYNYMERFRKLETGGLLSFIKLRFARIYPVHFATLHAVLAFALIDRYFGTHLVPGAPTQYGLKAWFLNIFLLNGWWPSWQTCNDISWSISVEWLLYMVFPLLVFMVVRVKSAEWSLIAASGILIAFLYGMIFLTAEEILEYGGGRVGSGPIRGVAGMLTGIWLFSARRFLRPSNIWGWISTAAAAGIIAFPWLFEAYEYMSGMLVIPLLALLVLSLSFGKGPAASLVSTKPAVLWGEASYSLYMTSSLSHMFFAAALPWKMLVNAGLPVRLATLTLIFAGVAGVTAATYKWVDQPWRKRLRNLRLLDPPAIGPRQAGNAA